MKKILFVATVDVHILAFHIPYLKYFKELGYEVHVASSGCSEIPYCDIKYNIPFERSPFKLKNLKAYNQLKQIIDTNDFCIIHCHTPVGSVVTRLAARSARLKGTKVLYTAHGFHFFKGAPLINWLFYFPMEVFLSRYTDGIITINNEDYARAEKWMKCNVHFIHGVGVDENKFNPANYDSRLLRSKLGVGEDKFIIIYVAEINKNKNQTFLLEIINQLKNENPNILLLLVGKGIYSDKVQALITEYSLENHVKLLGFRKDVNELLALSDLAVSTSKREGLPVNVIEALSMGLPVVASKIRGHVDLIRNGENGFLCEPGQLDQFVKAISSIKEKNFTIKNKDYTQAFYLKSVSKEIQDIYKQYE